MSFYRNLILFRFPKCDARELADRLQEQVEACTLKPVGPLELRSQGWVTPFGAGDPDLVQFVGGRIELVLGTEERLLPGSVVSAELSKRLEHIRETEGRNPGGRERKRIKDEVLTDLIPRAFLKPSRVRGLIDAETGFAVIDTSSRKRAEEWVTKVRETLGSFPAVPVNAESSPRALMTAWIAGEPLPEGLVLGENGEPTGDMEYLAIGPGFVSLEESPHVFASTPSSALSLLLEVEQTAAGAKA